MARNNTVLAVALTLFVVAAPATAAGTAVGTQAAADQADDDGDLPPGVDENGTVNFSELYEAHQEVLLDEGYRTSENLTIWLNGSTFLTAATDTEASPDGENTSVTKDLTVVGLDYDVAVWANESQKTVRIEKDNNTTYKVLRTGPPEYAGPDDEEMGPDRGMGPHGDDRGPHDSPGMSDDRGMDDGMGMGMYHGMSDGERVPGYAVLFLEAVAGNFTVENETTVDDRTAYTLTAPVEVDEDVKGDYSGNVSILVDERGVVHSANVTVESDEYDGVTRYTFTLEELGVETVEEPDWLDEVPENATEYGPPAEEPGTDDAENGDDEKNGDY